MRIAVDTGGTFTDVVLAGGERLVTHKRLSTPHDPAEAVLAGIAELAGDAPARVIHGSTVATNALLEGKGARAVLLTTAGFEDVLEIGRQNRPDLHALEVVRPPPVIPAERRLGVRERIGSRGEVVRPLEDVESAAAAVAALAPESVAVVLLHAYANPAHEAQLAEALRAALPGVPITVSHRLLPEFRELERTSTCAVNAYVAPKMAGYLGRLDAGLPGGRLTVMQSNGGTLSAERAADEAVHTVLSGPAGGVVGARHLAAALGETRLVTFDMGGTSTDVCLVDGEPVVTTEASLAGHPLRVPLLDIHTVGAGGGSIGWCDAGGALRVGPESAGADPGPACYGRGGTAPTVTDAHLVLGRLSDRFLGGAMRLDVAAAERAVSALASQIGLDVDACARGIVEVANAVMARAIRRISLERGHDPARFSLVSFGGAGGLHACELAEALSIPRVIVPAHPGLLSAYGMLVAPPLREQAQTVLAGADIEDAYRSLTTRLETELAAEGHRGLTVRRLADLRYRGQSYELTVDADGSMGETVARFHAAHERAFGLALEREVEWVAARVRVTGPVPDVPLPVVDPAPGETDGRVVERRALALGTRLDGPRVVTEYSGTTWVPAGWSLEVGAGGALVLEAGG